MYCTIRIRPLDILISFAGQFIQVKTLKISHISIVLIKWSPKVSELNAKLQSSTILHLLNWRKLFLIEIYELD